jgi:hypothetical protein
MTVLHYMFGSLLSRRICTGCQARCVIQNQHGLCSLCQASVHQFVSMRRHLRGLPLLLKEAQNRQPSRLRLIERSPEQH